MLDGRVRTLSFAAVFALFAYVQPIAYRTGYPTRASRIAFARSFGDNSAVRLFYGEPQNLLSVSGYTAWRVGGTLAIFAAVFGVLAAVRALRTEEDAGRTEMVLAGAIGRRAAFLSAMAAPASAAALLWLAETAGLIAGGLPAGGAAFLALCTASIVPVCAGVGALACQIAPTRRTALELSGGVVALLFLMRVTADTASGWQWLRWLTPLGWAEDLRPFAGARPLVLALPAATTLILLVITSWIAAHRDVGTGVFSARESSSPRLWLLSSTTAHALREERTSLAGWTLGVAFYAFIVGVLAKSSSSAGISARVSRELGKLGSGSITTPSGYVGFTFIFFVLAVSLFAGAQVSAIRREEADGQLETLLAQPVARARWLGGRLALAALAAGVLALIAGLVTWVGIGAGGVAIPAGELLEAGANCLPPALLFLGIGALTYAVFPRAGAGITYAAIVTAFLWNLVAALLGAPNWLVTLSPFAHIGLVPAEPFRAGAAAVMLAIATGCSVAATTVFLRRDIATA